jgi:hypothetical protein
MPLSDATIIELRSELLSLKDRRRDLDRRISAIESLLGSEPGGTAQGSLLPVEPHRVVEPVPAGLRASALQILAKSDRPMKAPEIAAVLLKQGFQNTASTSLSTRIYNDFYRLSKDGHVVKRDEDGRFILAEAKMAGK